MGIARSDEVIDFLNSSGFCKKNGFRKVFLALIFFGGLLLTTFSLKWFHISKPDQFLKSKVLLCGIYVGRPKA
jgi:hypothetical protein